jgi:subtilase family serine protease
VSSNLSANAVRDSADVLLTGTRTVKSLPAGATASGSTTVTVPSATPPGTYLLLACTDDFGVVGERDETNNCMAAATSMIVQVPDLAAIAVSDPPGSATRNARFAVTDSVENQGSASAAASRVRYSLLRDAAPGAGDTMLGGIRAIAKLAAGAISSGTVTVTVPSSTAAGSYYLLACADGMGAVSELVETNNCQGSARKVVINS